MGSLAGGRSGPGAVPPREGAPAVTARIAPAGGRGQRKWGGAGGRGKRGGPFRRTTRTGGPTKKAPAGRPAGAACPDTEGRGAGSTAVPVRRDLRSVSRAGVADGLIPRVEVGVVAVLLGRHRGGALGRQAAVVAPRGRDGGVAAEVGRGGGRE